MVSFLSISCYIVLVHLVCVLVVHSCALVFWYGLGLCLGWKLSIQPRSSAECYHQAVNLATDGYWSVIQFCLKYGSDFCFGFFSSSGVTSFVSPFAPSLVPFNNFTNISATELFWKSQFPHCFWWVYDWKRFWKYNTGKNMWHFVQDTQSRAFRGSQGVYPMGQKRWGSGIRLMTW